MHNETFQAPSPETLAELLPQYGIESFIAQGGMGAVYKGRQLSLERDVAIKVLPKELGCDADFRESFITEAKAMAKLNHPNLLGVFDYGDVDGMPYIVMEYVEGGSLHQAAWNQAIEPATSAAIVKGICDGLAHAHENGIVHRDIKPSNILLTTKIEPKVADFGLAHSTEKEESGVMMGTPGYTAPEVFHDPSQAGELADLYSVGVIFHQLLTGIDPAGSTGPPTKATGNLRLDAIWRKATNVNPTQRYQSIAALSADLEKWMGTKRPGTAGLVTAGATAYRPPRTSTQPIKTGGGGGALMKLVIIGVLGAAVYYTYEMLQEQRAKIDKAVAESQEASAKPVQTTIVRVDPVSSSRTSPTRPIEESSPPPTVTDRKPVPIEPEYTPGDPELRAKAVELIGGARANRDKALSGNAREMIFQIGASIRSAKPEEVSSLEDLKEDFDNNRIPNTDDVHGLPNTLQRDFQRARAKERSILDAYNSDLVKIRNSYVSHLAANEKKETDPLLKANLKKQAKRAGDLGDWIDLLAPEKATEAKHSSGTIGNRSVIGKLYQQSTSGTLQRWIAQPDGGLEIVGRSSAGNWEMMADGTFLVRMGNSLTYRYKRKGDEWIGDTASAGILTRGDW